MGVFYFVLHSKPVLTLGAKLLCILFPHFKERRCAQNKHFWITNFCAVNLLLGLFWSNTYCIFIKKGIFQLHAGLKKQTWWLVWSQWNSCGFAFGLCWCHNVKKSCKFLGKYLEMFTRCVDNSRFYFLQTYNLDEPCWPPAVNPLADALIVPQFWSGV